MYGMRRSEVRSLGSVKRLSSRMSALACGFLGLTDARVSMGEVWGGRVVAIRAAYVHGAGRGGAALAEVAVGLPLLWEVDNAGALCPWFVARRFSAAAGGAACPESFAGRLSLSQGKSSRQR